MQRVSPEWEFFATRTAAAGAELVLASDHSQALGSAGADRSNRCWY
jgi:hypothetical protein